MVLDNLQSIKTCIHIFFISKQPHFRVEPRVAMKITKMRLKVAMKLLSISGIEAKVATFFDNLTLKCMKTKQKLAKLTKVAKNL